MSRRGFIDNDASDEPMAPPVEPGGIDAQVQSIATAMDVLQSEFSRLSGRIGRIESRLNLADDQRAADAK